MHELDTELVSTAKARIRAAKDELAESLQEQLDEYQMAASLSRGKDPARSRYWAMKAYDLAIKFRRRLSLPVSRVSG